MNRTAAEAKLQSVRETCSKPDWDGEGADPVKEKTFEIAQQFLDWLPDDLPFPQVAPVDIDAMDFHWPQYHLLVTTVTVYDTTIDYYGEHHGVTIKPKTKPIYFDAIPPEIITFLREAIFIYPEDIP